jgi:hypothetical protein
MAWSGTALLFSNNVLFEVLTAVMMMMMMMMMMMFWFLRRVNSEVDNSISEKHTVSILMAEYGDSVFLRDAGIYLRLYTASKPKHQLLQFANPFNCLSKLFSLLKQSRLEYETLIKHLYT